jgi:site-specific DNA-methyltransferase (adenine-specific)
VELRDLESYGEPGAIVHRVDCVELMRLAPVRSVDAIFADPPYQLSGRGLTAKSGRLAPVDKENWDRSMGFKRIEPLLMSTSTRSVSSAVRCR